MKNIFNSVKLNRPGKNSFDLSHDVKLSLDMGNLVPTLCMETIPGDKFNIGCDSLVRFAPLVAPVMHRFDVSVHYFFVPNRLLWPNWENFITNTPLPGGAIPALPIIPANYSNYTRLMDYFGIPTPLATNTEFINAMPLSAYQLIYNEYYRDQNLVPEVDHMLVDGTNPWANLTTMRRRAWEHDYFTSALPFAQKGPAVSIPLGDVQLKSNWDANSLPFFEDENGFRNTGQLGQDSFPATNPGIHVPYGVSPDKQAYNPDGSLEVSPTTITDLRRAFKLQEWLEKQARAGSRYVENILSHFGVKSSDRRLQRPEYITGVKSPIIVSEVLNTSDTASAPQGSMAGHGVGVQQGKYGSYYCEEHGYIIGIMSVMPKTSYSQGIPKHFLKTGDPFEYYWPSFANIGEQEIKNREIYAFQGVPGADPGDATFGYIPRYSEYKFQQNRVCGDFRTSLNFWHASRLFATPPALNQTFIECNPDDRIFAVPAANVDSVYCQILHKIQAIRAMPKYGNPSF